MAGMTLAQIRTRVERKLAEAVNSGYWTDSEKNDAVNKALVICSGDVMFKTTTATFTAQPLKSVYGLPTDMLVPLRLRDTSSVGGTNNFKLFPVTMPILERERPAWRTESGNPAERFFFESDTYFWLYPPPSEAYDEATFTWDYVPVPATLSADADSPDAPLSAIEAAIELATAFLLFKKDTRMAAAALMRYAQKASSFAADRDRDSEMKTAKFRPAEKFDKAHHHTTFKVVRPYE